MTRRRGYTATRRRMLLFYPRVPASPCPRVSIVRMQPFKGENMLSYLVGRVLQTLLSMLVVISIVFVLTRLSGNPVHLLLDVNATQRDFDLLTRHLGLDKPLMVQYGIYVKNIVQGDFGKSVLSRRPVTEHIWERLPALSSSGSWPCC